MHVPHVKASDYAVRALVCKPAFATLDDRVTQELPAPSYFGIVISDVIGYGLAVCFRNQM